MADTAELTELTAMITSEFVSNNRVGTSEISGVIAAVYTALAGLNRSATAPDVPEFAPAVTVRKSLANPGKIISMIDGKPYSMLKRHLGMHGITPDEYRARYNLPADYPMTAPAYSAQRKALAFKIGLGRKPKVVEAAPPAKKERKPRAAVPVEAVGASE